MSEGKGVPTNDDGDEIKVFAMWKSFSGGDEGEKWELNFSFSWKRGKFVEDEWQLLEKREVKYPYPYFFLIWELKNMNIGLTDFWRLSYFVWYFGMCCGCFTTSNFSIISYKMFSRIYYGLI